VTGVKGGLSPFLAARKRRTPRLRAGGFIGGEGDIVKRHLDLTKVYKKSYIFIMEKVK
jgi:hypothetical protein